MNWKKDDTFLSKWLNNELSKKDKDAFEASEEGQEFIRILKASELIEPAPYDPVKEYDRMQSRLQSHSLVTEKAYRMPARFQLALAASIAVVIGMIFLFSKEVKTFQTVAGENEEVLLPDGSEVILNVGSRLSYYPGDWKQERQVTLEGEAFFKVKKGASFKVETRVGAIQVLGTSFNVKSREKVLEVVCFTGKVAIDVIDESRVLNSLEKLVFLPSKGVSIETLPSGSAPSWTNGIVELKQSTFPMVLKELEYVFGITVTYDQSLDSLSYTGAFPMQNAEVAFKLVFEPLNISYSYDLTSKSLEIHGLNE